MSALFASGHAVDIVLAVMLIEVVVLTLRGRDALTMIIAVLPGAMILLGTRAALTGAAWPCVAGALAASFPLHVLDLRRRGL